MMCSCIVSQSCSSLTVMWCTSVVWRPGIFSLWQHRVRDSVLISAGVAAGDRGLVAARSGCTCHLALSLPDKKLCVCSTAPPEELSRPCHLNMTRGSVNVYSVTESPLCCVWASAIMSEAIHEQRTLMFTDQTTIIASPEYQRKWVNFSKKATTERDAT